MDEPDLFGVAEELVASEKLREHLESRYPGARAVALEQYVRRHLCLRLKNDYDHRQVDRVLEFMHALT